MKKQDKKLTVSIGIPAYNEELNIYNLISKLLKQKEQNYILKEIIIISDKSNDNTESEAKRIIDNRIKYIENKRRIGQALTQNKIKEIYKGKILVLLNADILPKNNLLISKLVEPFYTNFNLGIVSGKMEPVMPQTYLEKVLVYSHIYKEEIYVDLNNGDSLYMCHGRIRAFSRELLNRFKWKKTYGEDTYSYIYCKSLGFKFIYKDDAVILFRLPQNLNDHLKQSSRFLSGPKKMKNYFKSELVNEMYSIPITLMINKTIKYLFNDPLLFISYLLIAIYTNFFSFFNLNKAIWEISETSKKI